MKVKDLIVELQKVKDQDAKVIVKTEIEGTGCDTCGYGATIYNNDVERVSWLDGTGEVELEIS